MNPAATHGETPPARERTPATFRDRLVLAAVLAAACALRLPRLGLGLPDFLEEAIPFRIALGMRSAEGGALDLNPHAFNYPTLSIYLHFVVQQAAFGLGVVFGLYRNYADYLLAFQLDPTPMVLAARGLGVVAELATLAAIVRIARPLGAPAALTGGLLFACAPIAIVTSSSIFTDTVMAAFAAWAVERMLAWDRSRQPRDLALAALLVGLAAGSKYPGAALLAPLLALLAWRLGVRAIAPAVMAVGLAFAAFLASSPFVALDFASFWRDFRFEGGHAARGHLGTADASFAFHARNLLSNLGLPGVLLAALGVAAAFAGPARRREAAAAAPARSGRAIVVATAVAFAVMGVPIALARIDADRYLVGVLPFAAILAAAGFAWLANRVPARLAGPATALAAAIALAGPASTGLSRALENRETTQVEARRWCEERLPKDAVLLQEGYSARLVSEVAVADLQGEPSFRSASAPMRRRLLEAPAFRVVPLPLLVAGSSRTRFDTARGPVTLEVFARAEALNAVFYRPELFAAADYVMTSSAVRGRFEADPARFVGPCALYRRLDEAAPVVATFAPRGRIRGPEIRVHRIDAAARERLAAGARLDACWWTATIPEGYRREASRLLGAGEGAAPAACAPTGEPVPWVRSLAGLYGDVVHAFARQYAFSLAASGRWEASGALALGTLTALPGEAGAAVIYGLCEGKQGRWAAAVPVLERALQLQPAGRAPGPLRLQYARTLWRTGARERARREVRAVLAEAGGPGPLAEQAAELLASIDAGDRAR